MIMMEAGKKIWLYVLKYTGLLMDPSNRMCKPEIDNMLMPNK